MSTSSSVTTVHQRVVQTPVIASSFAVEFPEAVVLGVRPLTYDEAAERIHQVHDWYQDAALQDAMLRWHVGQLFHLTPKERGRASNILSRLEEDYGVTRKVAWLYECASFFATYHVLAEAEQAVRGMVEEGFYSWTAFRKKYLRPEREAEDDGQSAVERAAERVDRAIQQYRNAEEDLEEGLALLPKDHPYRETAEALREQVKEHLGEEAMRLLSGADAEDTRGPWRSEEYLDFVRSHACPWTGDMNPDAAHLGGWTRGTSTKHSDCYAVPQAHELHMGVHHEDARWVKVLRDGPDPLEVALSLMGRWITGRNDGPVKLEVIEDRLLA